MKSLKWFSISLILLSFIFAGCGGNDEEDSLFPGGSGDPGMVGFAAMKVGSWEELRSPEGDVDRYEYIGVDTYNGTECYLLEFDSVTQGQRNITQIWISKATGQAVLMVMKDTDGNVTKMDIPQNYDPPTSTGGEMPATATNLGNKKYTTPTGKTVDAVAYKITTPYGEVESWSSSQVPFGEVKTMTNGVINSELYDFGSSGAVRDISKQEAENAKPFDIWGGGDIGGGDVGGGDVGGGDVGGGDIGGGDVNDPIGNIGNIKITIGAGTKPDIKVSQPIEVLTVTGLAFVWGFESKNDQLLPGPFKYGVIPNGAQLAGMPVAPDLVAGTMYTIMVDDGQGNFGLVQFTR